MNSNAAASRLPLAGVILVVVVGLGALLLGVAGNHSGAQLLVDTGARVEVLQDPDRQFSWPEVREAGGWQAFTSRGYIHADYGEAVWVRVTLPNPTDEPLTGVLADPDFIADEVTLWAPDPAALGGWRRSRTGQSVPAAEKPIWGRYAALPLDVPARAETTFYLRGADHFATWLQPQWWPDGRNFFAAQLRVTMADSLYFGILLALLVYNGILCARLRHRDLGYYLGYLGFTAGFMIFARAQDQVIGVAVQTPFSEPLITICLAGAGYFFVQFSREFLQLGAIAPRLDRATRILGLANLLLAVGAVSLVWTRSTDWMRYVIVIMVLTHVTLLLSGIVAWRAGSAHARYFLLSFSLLLAGALPLAVNWVLAIPFGNAFLGSMLGSALEMLFLSLALSDRFAKLQADRYAAQLAEEKARLEVLRYQLNPHFLFNALNSIYGLVLPHSASAGELVRRLSDFCRGTLTRPRDRWQTLGEEFAMLRSYLEIEKARWDDRLEVELSLDPAADDFLLPPLLLLPLVDNAIKHGGATSPDVLTLRLATLRETDGAVSITLINSGEWVPDTGPRPSTSTSTGLVNIRERLARAFGPAHVFTTAAAEGWVTLTLRLPPAPRPAA